MHRTRPVLFTLVAACAVLAIAAVFDSLAGAAPAGRGTAAGRAASASKSRKPVVESVRGEVIEISCYLQDSRNRGDEHSACAQEGILAGGPVGILTGDGILYLVLGKSSRPPNELMAPYAGKKVRVTGRKLQRARMLAIVCEKVEELPAEKPGSQKKR